MDLNENEDENDDDASTIRDPLELLNDNDVFPV